jgi:hypothetical protein
MTDRIPNSELVRGGVYHIVARNFSIGICTGRGFVGPREKFGDVFLFEEYYQEMPGEPRDPFGTAVALERLGTSFYPGSFGADEADEEQFFRVPDAWVETIQKSPRSGYDQVIHQGVLAVLSSAQQCLSQVSRIEYAIRGSDLVLTQAERRWEYGLRSRTYCGCQTFHAEHRVLNEGTDREWDYDLLVCDECGHTWGGKKTPGPHPIPHQDPQIRITGGLQ